MTRLRIDQLPTKYQNQVASQMEGVCRDASKSQFGKPASPVSKPRIRQNSAGLNRTEQAFLDWLKEHSHGESENFTQSVTLKLGNGVRYTPDFIQINYEPLEDAAGYAHTLTAFEVKGFMRDDAAVKLKVAASLYPWIKFHLVTKRKGGGWDVQEILA